MSNAGNRTEALDSGAEQGSGAVGIDPVVAEAMKRFRRCVEWENTARQNFIDDVKFAEGDATNGYQWPAAVKRNRDVDKRPCLTLNIVRQHNKQIINDQMKNKAAIKIRPVGGGASVESANLISAIVRDIEYRSNAQSAYKCGSEFQVKGGIGWWRLTTQYCGPETFDQEIRILRIKDPLSVYMDPDCQQEDCSDARFAFVFDLVPREKFFDMYPEFDGQVTLQPLSGGSDDDDWVTKDYIRVAEYFRKVSTPDELLSFIDPKDGTRKSLLKSKMPPELYELLKLSPFTRSRKVNLDKIEWKLIVGNEVADETDWPSAKYIPLVRVLGEETQIEGILDRKGHTRSMTDAQRMYNYNAAGSIYTRIPTPSGWKLLGQIETGDLIFDEKGNQVPVAEALPIRYNEDCFKVTFDTGYSVVTDGGHIWKVEEKGKRKAQTFDWKTKTITTAELVAKKHFVKLAEPLKLEEKELELDPYLLGVWLGDGASSSTEIAAHVEDVEEERQLIADLGYTVGEIRGVVGNGCKFTVHGIRHILTGLGLLGDKHVPAKYLRASEKQRLSLLQGLMDTDGHFAKAVNQCVFVNKSKAIASAFMELCASLGIKATVNRQPEYHHQDDSVSQTNYRIQFTANPDVPVFRLHRKAVQQTAGRPTHWRRTKRTAVVSVERVESVPVRCLKLNTAEHLFLWGEGMIPTHNSAEVEFVALQSKTPYVATAKAIEDYEVMWNTANQVNHSVLIYNHIDPDNPDKPLPPPERQQPPTSAPGFLEGMQTAFNQMMMTSGQWQNQMGMLGNERTGAAIRERQAQADNSVYNFQDSYEDSIRYTGKIILDLIPHVYDTKRVMQLQLEDGEEIELVIDPSSPQALIEHMDRQGQIVRRVLNPKLGNYDVQADVGKAYGTRREETVQSLTLVLTQAPQLVPLIGDLLLRAMDFKEAQEAAMRLRRMVPPQALGKGPTPQEQALQAKLTASQQALAKSLAELSKKDIKLAGKNELRITDVYEAHTKRIQALKDLIPDDPVLLANLLNELDDDTFGEQLTPVLEATKRRIEREEMAEGGDTPEEEPPVSGARKAPDGQWYLEDPTRKGKYLRVNPEARQ